MAMGTLEQTNMFERFRIVQVPERSDYQLDSFLGTIVRRDFREETLTGPFGVAQYPPQDSEYQEWVDLLEAVLDARDSFTFAEIGAGFGRWSVRAAFAAAQLGIPAFIHAVEADRTHFEWMGQHFADNHVSGRLTRAAVTNHHGEALFTPSGNPRGWYGQWIVNTPQHGESVPAITLSSILQAINVDHVDLIDMDIQGEELKVIREAIGELDTRVKRLHIGTHSTEIESGLRSLLYEHGWMLGVEIPVDPSVEDGVQSWQNPRRLAG